MKPDDLIQAMRTARINLIRSRLIVMEVKDPATYRNVCALFAPMVENKKKGKP